MNSILLDSKYGHTYLNMGEKEVIVTSLKCIRKNDNYLMVNNIRFDLFYVDDEKKRNIYLEINKIFNTEYLFLKHTNIIYGNIFFENREKKKNNKYILIKNTDPLDEQQIADNNIDILMADILEGISHLKKVDLSFFDMNENHDDTVYYENNNVNIANIHKNNNGNYLLADWSGIKIIKYSSLLGHFHIKDKLNINNIMSPLEYYSKYGKNVSAKYYVFLCEMLKNEELVKSIHDETNKIISELENTLEYKNIRLQLYIIKNRGQIFKSKITNSAKKLMYIKYRGLFDLWKFGFIMMYLLGKNKSNIKEKKKKRYHYFVNIY